MSEIKFKHHVELPCGGRLVEYTLECLADVDCGEATVTEVWLDGTDIASLISQSARDPLCQKALEVWAEEIVDRQERKGER